MKLEMQIFSRWGWKIFYFLFIHTVHKIQWDKKRRRRELKYWYDQFIFEQSSIVILIYFEIWKTYIQIHNYSWIFCFVKNELENHETRFYSLTYRFLRVTMKYHLLRLIFPKITSLHCSQKQNMKMMSGAVSQSVFHNVRYAFSMCYPWYSK